MVRLRSLLLLLAASAAAQAEDASLARLLPPETPFYFESRTPTPAELEDMCLFKPLKDPRLKALLERVIGDESSLTSTLIPLGPALVRLNQDMSHPSFAMTVRYEDAQGERKFRFQNRIALAWVGLAQQSFPVDLIAALEVDTESDDVIETLKRIGAAARLMIRGEPQGDVDAEIEELFTQVEHKGVAFSKADFEFIQIYIVPAGRIVALTTTEARARDVIDRHLGNGAKSLATSDRHVAMLRNAPGTGTATTVIALQVDRALNAVAALFPQQATQIRFGLSSAGLGGLKSLTTVARVDGQGVSATTSVMIDGPRRGLARFFEQGKPAKYGCLAFAPKNSIYATCGNFSPADALDACVEVAGMALLQQQAKFDETWRVKLREDLLAQIGPEAALIVAGNRGLIPDLALVFESPDAARLEKSLLALLAHAPWPAGTGVKSFTIGDTRVHTVPLLHRDFDNVPLAPTFGVVDGHLLVTLFPISFQRFRQIKRGQRPSLAENRDFARLRERVPEGAMGVSYLDLARVFEVLYETCIPLLQAMPAMFGTATQHYELPDVEVFSKHLYGRVAWRTADDKGFYWQSHSSMDTSAFMLSLGGLAAGGVALFMARAEEAEVEPPVPVKAKAGPDPRLADARLCRWRMRLLRARIRIYQQEHAGALPAGIDQLRAKHVAAETFISPGLKQPYVYLGPDGKGGILLHGHPNGPTQRICVLTTDLEMKRITRKELREKLGNGPARGDR